MNQKIFYIMGVSGCGKSTIGKLLAERLNLPFFDGDDYHPESNVKKMKTGNPLNDEDRLGWLQNLNTLAFGHKEEGAVIVCSALKESYRKILRQGIEAVTEFVYLEGSIDLITERLKKRSDHFMPIELLKSQFEALEPPSDCIKVSIDSSKEEIIQSILTSI